MKNEHRTRRNNDNAIFVLKWPQPVFERSTFGFEPLWKDVNRRHGSDLKADLIGLSYIKCK